METSNGIFSRFWQRNKIIFKGFLIALLVILLLIPAKSIENLISERQGRQQEAVGEVSAKWAGSQTITGPVVCIPYIHSIINDKGQQINETKFTYFLPARLSIRSTVYPEIRYRGIYKVIVYTTILQINGNFNPFSPEVLNVPIDKILWREAAVFFNVSDVRGLKEEVRLNWKNADLELTPGKYSNEQFKSSLSSNFPLVQNIVDTGGDFRMTIKLKGSENLLFVPVGKETSVEMQSSWPDPSFTGQYLPDTRNVSDSGFTANWKVLYMNRTYPQSWKDVTYDLGNSAFGVNLLVPVDAYTKSLRSVKYAILCIVLTFTAFLLIELIYSRSIHPLQYVLVGFALCIFYTLLLSISEYLGFNVAYVTAAVATILLIAFYINSVLRSGKMGFFVAILLSMIYGFIFILIQSQDYALLMGSIGFFITLALIMYFSRRVKWG